jgi:hypothetical protein
MPDELNYRMKAEAVLSGLVTPAAAMDPAITQTPEPAPATAAANLAHIDEVQKVSQDLKRLLGGCEKARLKADVKEHIERLNAWTDAYLSGLDAAQKISETAVDTLIEAQKELSLGLEEYLRLEDEGGNPATPEQQRHTDELSKALRRVHGLITTFGSAFDTSGDLTAAAEPDVLPQPAPDVQPVQAPEVNPPSPPENDPTVQPDIPPVERPEI